ncbi:putative Replication initiation factor [Candidatus Propionivibrio aalborgensis]|uniref:Putative Replication initiation factor n=1 Tax=Candidatus Propionivibrio aalborgensis TaxID=1860101 RepID=A0A1A8Y1X5_9RHOO|nr:putative Replication initiation factor [Candidatus Propionivibrio aalborgensis]
MDSPSFNSSDLQVNSAGLGLAARIAAPAATVRTNEAGTAALEYAEAIEESITPRLVIRGENHSNQPNPYAAFIDWLNFTFRYRIDGESSLIDLDRQLVAAFGFALGSCRNRKHLNYEQSWEIGNGYGIFATGGDSVAGTSLVSLSGEGCSMVRSWIDACEILKRHKAKITRVDLAHDDYDGLISLSSAVEWYLAGDFHSGKGRPPNGELIDDFGSGSGKTLYIGKRVNGKLLRIYEKGKQLGDPLSPWVRWELELHSRDRVIPLDVLLTPGPYLAAAYPCTEWISSTQSRIATSRKTTVIGLDVLLRYCRLSYGKLIWTLQHVCGYTPEQIIEKLSVMGLPKRIDHPVPGEVS